jgi:hypothetical protein
MADSVPRGPMKRGIDAPTAHGNCTAEVGRHLLTPDSTTPPQTRLHHASHYRRRSLSRARADAPARGSCQAPHTVRPTSGACTHGAMTGGVPQRASGGGRAPPGHPAPLCFFAPQPSRAPPLPHRCHHQTPLCRRTPQLRHAPCPKVPDPAAIWFRIWPSGQPAGPGQHADHQQRRDNCATLELASVSGEGADPAWHEVDLATTEP